MKPIEDWGWWYTIGSVYVVTPFPYRATKGAFIDKCSCVDCVVERLGEQLFSMYEVIEGEYTGAIIPVVACEFVRDSN